MKRGHYVEVWCPDTADRSYLPLSKLATEHVLPLKEDLRKVNQRRKTHNFKWMYQRVNAVKNHCLRCAEQIGRGRFDVLLANSCGILHISHVGAFLEIPKVIYLGEPSRMLYEARPTLPWVAPQPSGRPWYAWNEVKKKINDAWVIHQLRVRAREEVSAAKSYDTILVNSRFSRENVLRVYGLESKVCYLGVDTNLFQPKGENRRPFVVGMGMMGYNKGVDRAIRAVAAMPQQKRPSLVWIANSIDKVYEKRMRHLAGSSQVDFVLKYSLGDHEVMGLLSGAAAFIYTPRLEPFGLAPLEANACETAVVGISEGGLRESIEEGVNGFLIDDDNPQELAKAAMAFTEDLAYASEMGKKAREYVVNNWSLHSAQERIEGFLLRAIDDN